jgi:hypothetical protein
MTCRGRPVDDRMRLGANGHTPLFGGVVARDWLRDAIDALVQIDQVRIDAAVRVGPLEARAT